MKSVISALLVISLGASSGACGKTQGGIGDPASGPESSLNVHTAPIVGGTDATFGVSPWTVALMDSNDNAICSGVLLGQLKVLTTAHCVDRFGSPGQMRVVAGVNDKSDTSGAAVAFGASFTRHEGFQQGGPFANDVAIVHLSSPISAGPTIQYATLATDPDIDSDGSTVTIVGWGRTSASTTQPATLQVADIGVIGAAQCGAMLSGLGSPTDGQGCVFDGANNITPGDGDAGSAVTLDQPGGQTVVVGILSWGITSPVNGALATYPAVYTRVADYAPWIADN